jgi:hypothetical protein
MGLLLSRFAGEPGAAVCGRPQGPPPALRPDEPHEALGVRRWRSLRFY